MQGSSLLRSKQVARPVELWNQINAPSVQALPNSNKLLLT